MPIPFLILDGKVTEVGRDRKTGKRQITINFPACNWNCSDLIIPTEELFTEGEKIQIELSPVQK